MTNEERAREVAERIFADWVDVEKHTIGDMYRAKSIILAALNAATAELEEERERLREALVPFAEAADWNDIDEPEMNVLIALEYLLAARAALAKKEPSNDA